MSKKKSKVTALYGVCPTGGNPEPDVIELLEFYLKKAKRGEISGLAIAYVDGGQSIGSAFASGCADKNLLMASTHGLHTRITNIWYSEFEDLSTRIEK
jgi:hypothetical protein